MTIGETSELHLPEGINYECTGCGRCCGGWSVPLTPDDYERISSVDWAEYSSQFEGKNLYRELKKHEAEGTPNTHIIQVGANGLCPFLADNLCFIHSKFGAEYKPSICQLFPYCFNETPSGVYATVSFVSMGAVMNSGKGLAEQREVMESKLSEFRRLYPNHHPNWSKLELMGGKPITWEQYLAIEKQLIEYLRQRDQPMELRLLMGSAFLRSKAINMPMPSEITLSGSGQPVKLKSLDQHLLVALHRIYYPVRTSKGQGDFSAARFAYQVAFTGIFPGLKMVVVNPLSEETHSYSINDLAQMAWPGDDKDIEDLVYRFLFSHIFGKNYFGAGFGQLSLIAGYHHLLVTYVLIKLHAKALTRSRGDARVTFFDVVVAIRHIEKMLGNTSVGPYAAAVFELLLYSHKRAKRLLVAT